MSKLLRAGFFRLWRTNAFRFSALGLFLLGILFGLPPVCTALFDSETRFENLFFFWSTLAVPVCPIFCALFLSTELGSPLRNRLVCGFGRGRVWLSNFLICTVGCLLLCLCYALGVFSFPLSGQGFFIAPARQLLAVLGECLLLIPLWCSLFTLVCTLCKKPAVSAIVCILLATALFLCAAKLLQLLSEPPTAMTIAGFDVLGQPLTDETGELLLVPMENPRYLSGVRRDTLEFLYDLLPTGQAMQFSAGDAITHMGRKPLISLALTAVFTVTGLFIFKHKDIP